MTIVCDWLPPHFGAVGQYMTQRAELAARSGRQVTLVGLCAQENSVTCENIGLGELRTVRLRAQPPAKQRLLLRALWTAAINMRLAWAVARTRSREILVTGSPPFLSQLLIVANLFWRRSLTYRITDFYPETAIATGRMRFARAILPLSRWVRKRANRIEVIGEDQRRRLLESGIAADKLSLVRDTSPIRVPRQGPRAPRPFGANEFVLLYSGNLGMAHDLDTFCEGYRRHVQEGANRVRLWVNGSGVRLQSLARYCERHGLPLHVSPPVALEDLPNVLRAADAHLVLLGASYWGYVLPSKIYACLEAGQPVLFVGPMESDVAMLLGDGPDTYHCVVSPGDSHRCFMALEALASRG